MNRAVVDAVASIQRFNAGREPERLALKYRAMRASPLAFLRGSCHLFNERLPGDDLLRAAPPAWVCGDLHLENFGSYRGDNRLVYFDIDDFDESALAPCSWDLLRLATSLWLAAEGLQLARRETRSLVTALIDAYADALAGGKAGWVERSTAQGLVGALLNGLRERKRRDFLDQRTRLKAGRRTLRVDGRKALPASAAQQAAVAAFMARFAAKQADPAFFEPLDIARRVAGTGSLGLERWIVLVQGKGSPDGNVLLDLKAALPSSLAPHLLQPQPAWKSEAHRIVALQQRLQAVSMAFLSPVSLGGRPLVLRALQPSEDRIRLARPGPSAASLAELVTTLGRLAAWAHLRGTGRQGSASADELVDFGLRRGWRKTLLALSEDCARQARADADAFNVAWDGGLFG